MMACTGDGSLLPPFVIYRSLNLWDSWTSGGPKGTRYGHTKSGWMDQKTFEEWFLSTALPYLMKQDAPRALIGDNLSSHLSQLVISKCIEEDIKFICLPKNSTHMCQPLDISFFAPFKRYWRQILTEWKMKGNKGSLPKDQFPVMLNKLMEKIKDSAPATIKSGFEKCGLIPLNRQKVLAQLPTPSDTSSINHAMEGSLSELLKSLRYGENGTFSRRKRKLNIPPGKSATNIESEASDSGAADNVNNLSGLEDNVSISSSLECPNVNHHQLEESSRQKEQQQKKHVSYDEIQESDYLIIELSCNDGSKKSNKVTKHFVGKVMCISGNSTGASRSVEVKFLCRYKNSEDTFVWPQVEDVSFIYPHKVRCLLPQPEELRYGLLRFPLKI
ncbi:uncharacterized protein LOC134535878 isoform X2 [Bacillus rossius redtenbacheri]|uniref:uncharacterized protein LOC134535878 isoform X2 n=1 Tax=Bacillus rossius redtenbacheri TaxID=93214 RepID=UPI002FDD31E5